MASINKKKKAKNSHLYKGNENQKVHKLKRIAYFIKADRKKDVVAEYVDANSLSWTNSDNVGAEETQDAVEYCNSEYDER